MTGQILLLGYGNTLRQDDGAGQRVAETVGTWQLPHVRSLSCHQLMPEQAEDISTVDQVIFVDAFRVAPETGIEVIQQLIKPRISQMRLGHHGDPQSLLFLTHTIYGRSPKATSILIPGKDFGFGESFSNLTEKGIQTALDKIRHLVEKGVKTITRA